ncbi:ATP-binding protein [Streptomyces sp. Da 82-17]|uniref:ATP-binding protein n=1 Tax=Streptomyces sp. Da 82-17 TaxID=3377116 RepID=UPI0038D4578E
MNGTTDDYTPHPLTSGHSAVLRALAAWHMDWPGTPRVVVLTGSPGSGCTRILTAFLMLCDKEFRRQLPLSDMDPAIVPPEQSPPVVPAPAGRTASQVLWLLADHCGLRSTREQEIFTEIAALSSPVSVVVPDVDRAGAVRTGDEPMRLVSDVLKPLAAIETVRLLVDVPKTLASELVEGLPPGTVQVIDLNEPEWADPQSIAGHARTALGAGDEADGTDQARAALAQAIARKAGTNHLVVELVARSLSTTPAEADSLDGSDLPATIGEFIDWHARRVGIEPQTLRRILTPIALAEGEGLPAALWGPLSSALTEAEPSTLSDAALLAGPLLHIVEQESGTPLLRLLHPALGEEIRAGIPLRSTQAKTAMALLRAVPEQDWSRADRYVRDHVASHALAAGQLPQLLTDPGLFVHADPVPLRAAVEAVPVESLNAPARTYRRIAPLLTRIQADAGLRAALLETAFVVDDLPQYAEAVHKLGLKLPWRTLWSLPVQGIRSVTAGVHSDAEGGSTPVAVLAVPGGTPGSQRLDADNTSGDLEVVIRSLALAPQDDSVFDPSKIRLRSEDERQSAPLALSHGGDFVRVWDRRTEEIAAALVSDTPFTSVDLSPEGVLVVATEKGATALHVVSPGHNPSPL